jgi:hypothetical protein
LYRIYWPTGLEPADIEQVTLLRDLFVYKDSLNVYGRLKARTRNTAIWSRNTGEAGQ